MSLIWKKWDMRCNEVFPMQQKIDATTAGIKSLLQVMHTTDGQSQTPNTYSLLLKEGKAFYGLHI